MRLFFPKVFSILAIFISLIAAYWMHVHLPNILVATHFGIEGQADGFMPRDQAFLMPVILFVCNAILFWVLPKIAPQNSKLERSNVAYATIWVAVTALLLMINALIIAKALDLNIVVTAWICVGVGILFIALGNILPKTRYNYLMGIRTPWTLSDERVWDATHRFAGPLLISGGLVVVVGGVIAPVKWQLSVLLLGSLLPVLISVVYSYLAARKFKSV